MSHQEDFAYYWRRAAEEQERGDEATNSAAAEVHHELARRYGALAARTSTQGPNLTLLQGGGMTPSRQSLGFVEGRIRGSSTERGRIHVARAADRESDTTSIAEM